MRDKQKKKVTSGNVYIRYAMRIRKRERVNYIKRVKALERETMCMKDRETH